MLFVLVHMVVDTRGGLRRGGLAPGWAPRMPIMTEDVRRQIEARP